MCITQHNGIIIFLSMVQNLIHILIYYEYEAYFYTPYAIQRYGYESAFYPTKNTGIKGTQH